MRRRGGPPGLPLLTVRPPFPGKVFCDLTEKSGAETLVLEEILCYNMGCIILRVWFGKKCLP